MSLSQIERGTFMFARRLLILQSMPKTPYTSQNTIEKEETKTIIENKIKKEKVTENIKNEEQNFNVLHFRGYEQIVNTNYDCY